MLVTRNIFCIIILDVISNIAALSNAAKNPFWSSENDLDFIQLIARRVFYGCRLKIHYIMVAIVISLACLGLMILICLGTFALFSTTLNMLNMKSKFQEVLKNKKKTFQIVEIN